MKIITKIWWRDRYREVDPEKPPVETRQLDSFLIHNEAPKCFMRGQGGWYKLTREGELHFVVRALYLMALKDWLSIAKNDYFTANLAGRIS